MPALNQCTISGTIYDGSGDPVAAGFAVSILRTIKNGNVIKDEELEFLTDAAGAIEIIAPRSSTIRVFSEANGGGTNFRDNPDLTVPNAATANLDDLIAAASVSASGITIKDEGTAFAALVGTINFVGSGIAAVETSAGLCTVTVSGGGTVTSVATGNGLTGGPITGSGTVNLSLNSSGGLTKVLGSGSNELGIVAGGVTNAMLAGSIAYSKLSLTGAVLNADLAGSIAYSKLSLTGAILNADLAGSIAYGKLSLTGAVVNADLAGSITAAKLVLTDITTHGTITTGGLGAGAVIGGVTMTLGSDQSGDVYYRNVSGVLTRIAAGAQNTIFTMGASSVPSWATPAATGASTALDNLASVSINTALLAQTGVDLGSTSKPFRNLFLFGGGTYATTYIELTGTPTGTRVVTLPDSNTSVAISSQTLTWSGPTAARTFTLPDAAATIARTDAGQTFTGVNIFTSPKILTDISDTNGNELFKVTATASAINEFTIANAATGSGPTLSATGGDTDVSITITPKGAGKTTVTGQLKVSNTGFGATNSALLIGGVNAGLGLVSTNNLYIQVPSSASHVIYMGGVSEGSTPITFGLANNLQYISFADVALARNAGAQFQINNGTAGRWGSLFAGVYDAGTATLVNGATLGHQSSGTPAAGLGIGLQLNLNSSTTADQNAARIAAVWTTATHASRAADLVLSTWLIGVEVEVLRLTSAAGANFAGIPRFNGTNSTGAGIAAFGANSPASTLTAPYTWISVTAADGSACFIPAWK